MTAPLPHFFCALLPAFAQIATIITVTIIGAVALRDLRFSVEFLPERTLVKQTVIGALKANLILLFGNQLLFLLGAFLQGLTLEVTLQRDTLPPINFIEGLLLPFEGNFFTLMPTLKRLVLKPVPRARIEPGPLGNMTENRTHGR